MLKKTVGSPIKRHLSREKPIPTVRGVSSSPFRRPYRSRRNKSVESSPSLSLPYFLLSLQCPSRNELYRLDGTSHPSGSRSAEKRVLLLCDPCPLSRTQKIFGSKPCPNRVCQISWLLANPSWLTAWAVKTLMTLSIRAATVDQSDFVVLYQPQLWFPAPAHLLIRIASLA
jgi:hypothetical protein